MIIELSKYRTVKPSILYIYNREICNSEVGKAVTVAAVATSVPIVVVAHYIMEEKGPSPELTFLIDRITKFYGYTDVKE